MIPPFYRELTLPSRTSYAPYANGQAGKYSITAENMIPNSQWNNEYNTKNLQLIESHNEILNLKYL